MPPPYLSLAQLRDDITQEEALESLLLYLEGFGFTTSSWQTGSIQLTLLNAFAEVWSRLTRTVATLSTLHFLSTAETDSLTALASSHYDVEREPATRTVLNVELVGAAVGPPYPIAAGQLVITEEDPTSTGLTYRNTSTGIVPASGSVVLVFQAEAAGVDSGAIALATTFALSTPLAGVTVSPLGAGDITTYGADAETDASLRTRCTTKWAGVLPPATKPADGYIYLALNLDTTVTRVYVDDSAATDGTVDVYLAANSGTVTVAQDVIDTQAEFDIHRPVTAVVTAIAAAEQAENVTADVYVTTALHDAAKEAEIEDAITAYIDSIPINGTVLDVPPNGYMLRSELLSAITSVEGVVSVDMSVPAADVAVNANEVVVENVVTLTYIDV